MVEVAVVLATVVLYEEGFLWDGIPRQHATIWSYYILVCYLCLCVYVDALSKYHISNLHGIPLE